MADVLEGCAGVEVVVGSTAAKGRVLRAVRDLSPDARVLSSPLEHRVIVPPAVAEYCSSCGDSGSAFGPQQKEGGGTDAAGGNESAPQLEADFLRMKQVWRESGGEGGHGFDVYWSALLSLTAEEGPAGAGWPCISDETQARLLQLFRPENISSTRAGQSLAAASEESAGHSDDFDIAAYREEVTSGRRAYPTRSAKTAHTVDVVAATLCKQFSLRVSEEKFEWLVLAWKYNSFLARIPSLVGEDATDDEGLEVYIAAAMASHSCVPNCYWMNGEDGSFELFAGQDGLEAHEEVSISYLTRESLYNEDTLKRREILARSWLFFCECSGCSCIEHPTCTQCSSKDHLGIIMCGAEEPLYPGFETRCDGCGTDDLHSEVGYYFNCPSCHLDLCPCCALKCRAASNVLEGRGSSWDGCWTHKHEPGQTVEGILGDTIAWATGNTSKIHPQEGHSFSTQVDDVVHIAELVGDELVWSDGDVWIRTAQTSSAPPSENAPA